MLDGVSKKCFSGVNLNLSWLNYDFCPIISPLALFDRNQAKRQNFETNFSRQKLESKFSYLLQYKSILICLDHSAECTECKTVVDYMKSYLADYSHRNEIIHEAEMVCEKFFTADECETYVGESIGVSQFPPPFSLPIPRDIIYLSNIC